MAVWQYFLVVGGGLLLVAAACLLPGRFFRIFKGLAVNMGLGMAVLMMINLFSANILLPVNGLTLAVSGMLGVPGVAALAVIAVI